MSRIGALKFATLGIMRLAIWWYSGSIGHFPGMNGVDRAHDPYDFTHDLQMRVHWPLHLLLPIALIVGFLGVVLFPVDVFRSKRSTNG